MKNKFSNEDFTVEKLPHNRKEVFFDCIKMRPILLFGIGLIFVLFLIPFILISLFNDASLIYFINNFDESEYITIYNECIKTFSLVHLVSFLFASIGISGVLNVLKKLIWGEPIFFWSDFKKGLKQNLGNCLLIFLFAAFINIALSFSITTLNNTVFIVLLFLTVLIALPILFWMIMQTAFYTNTFFGCLKNAVKFWIRTLPQSILFSLLALLPFLSFSISNLIVKYIVFIVSSVFIFPLVIMMQLLFSSKIFDEFINKKSYPEFVDKGIYR